MINLKRIVVPLLTIGILASISILNNQKNLNSIKNTSIESSVIVNSSQQTNNQNVLTDKVNAPIIKSEVFEGEEKVKANTPYKIKVPTAKLEDLKLVQMKSDKHSYKNYVISVVTAIYKSESKDLIIQQANTDDNNPLTDNNCEDIKLNDGTDAWVNDTMDGKGAIHIIFKKDGFNYDVCGYNLGRNKLIEIAESLK
jgi:hypothetical protein